MGYSLCAILWLFNVLMWIMVPALVWDPFIVVLSGIATAASICATPLFLKRY